MTSLDNPSGRVVSPTPDDDYEDVLRFQHDLRRLLGSGAATDSNEFQSQARQIGREMLAFHKKVLILNQIAEQEMERSPERFGAFLGEVHESAKALLEVLGHGEAGIDKCTIVRFAYHAATNDAARETLYTDREWGQFAKSFVDSDNSCNGSAGASAEFNKMAIHVLTNIQIVLAGAPKSFPGIMGSINVKRGFKRYDEYGLPAPKPWSDKKNLTGFPVPLPFPTYQCLLAAFGIDRRGRLHNKDGVMENGARRSFADIIHVMKLIDAKLTLKLNSLEACGGVIDSKQLELGKTDCQAIATRYFGSHHMAFIVDDQVGIDDFYSMISTMRDRITPDMLRREFLLLHKQFKKSISLNDGKDSSDNDDEDFDPLSEMDVSDSETSILDDVRDCGGQSIPVNGLDYGVDPKPPIGSRGDDSPVNDDDSIETAEPPAKPPGKGTKNPKKKRGRGKKKRKDFDISNPKLFITSLVSEELRKRINGNGLSVDKFTEAGKELRLRYGIEERDGADKDGIRLKIIKFGDGDAPCAFEIRNALSHEFACFDITESNKMRLCQNTQGDGNTSSVGAFFHCNHCPGNRALGGGFSRIIEGGANDETPTENQSKKTRHTTMCPHVKLGTSNSIVGTDADEFTRAKQLMASEFTNYFVDEVNRVTAMVKGEPWKTKAEPGQIKIRYLLSEKFSQSVAAKVKRRYAGKFGHLLLGLDYIPRVFMNMSIDKIGSRAKFDLHRDGSEILNSTLVNKRECVANNDILPLSEDMPVLTFVTGTGRIRTDVEWVSCGGQVLGKATTYNRDMHMQMFGAQTGGIKHRSGNSENKKRTQHEVVAPIVIEGFPVDMSVRMIETMRMSACPRCNETSYKSGVCYDALPIGPACASKNPYNLYNVVNCFAGSKWLDDVRPTSITDGTDESTYLEYSRRDDDGESDFATYKPPKNFKNPTAKQMATWLNEEHPEEFVSPEFNVGAQQRKNVPKIKKIKPTVGLCSRNRCEHLCAQEFVTHCMGQGLELEFVDSNFERTKDQPLFAPDHVLLNPGDYITSDRLPFVISKHSAGVLNPKVPNVIALIRLYKNAPVPMRKAVRRAVFFAVMDPNNENDRAVYKDLCEQCLQDPLDCNGFGGSTQKSDQSTRDMSSTTWDESNYNIGFAQRIKNRRNQAILMSHEKERVVLVVLDPVKWGDPELLEIIKRAGRGRDENTREQVTARQEDSEEPATAGGEGEDELDEGDNDDEIEDEAGAGRDAGGDGGEDDENDGGRSGADLCDLEVEVATAAKKTGLKSRLLVLGYHTITDVASMTLTDADVMDRFQSAGLLPYYKKNIENCSHMRHTCYHFIMKPIGNWELDCQLKMKARKRLQPVQVCIDDNRIISVPYSVARTVAQRFLEDDPTSWGIKEIPKDHHEGFKYLTEGHLRKALLDNLDNSMDTIKALETPMDDNQYVLSGIVRKYLFTPNELLNAMPAVSAQGAYRYKRDQCVVVWEGDDDDDDDNSNGKKKRKKKTKRKEKNANAERGEDTAQDVTYTVSALIRGAAGLLPDPLRLAPLPMCNADLDVVCQFASFHHMVFIKWFAAEHDIVLRSHRVMEENDEVMSYVVSKEDLQNPNVISMVTELLFMSVITRLTGRIQVMSQYNHPEIEGLKLPTMARINNFLSFLGAACKSGRKKKMIVAAQSPQHFGSLPKFGSFDQFGDMFVNLADHDDGFLKVRQYMERCDGEPDRNALVSMVARSTARCGELENGERLMFLCSKAVADVEATLPGFAGDYAPEDKYYGWGAYQGWRAMYVPKDMNRHQFFILIRDILLDERETCIEQLNSMGYDRRIVKRGGPMEIVSLHGWRVFSPGDVEHFLCKLWLATIHSHRSRNLSRVKTTHKLHCHPVMPVVGEWEQRIEPVMTKIWKSYEHCVKNKIVEYPKLLDFVNDLEKTMKERMQWLKANEPREEEAGGVPQAARPGEDNEGEDVVMAECQPTEGVTIE